MRRKTFFLCMTLSLLVGSGLLIAKKGVYLEAADYVKLTFNGTAPPASVIWLSEELKDEIERILSHPYEAGRVRYWQENGKSLWILDEIGKTRPITTGIVIENNRIIDVRVLTFRESRGWEVKHSFFTRQFLQAHLIENNELNQYIDGITGATLSVRAIKKQARIALLLHKQISELDVTNE